MVVLIQPRLSIIFISSKGSRYFYCSGWCGKSHTPLYMPLIRILVKIFNLVIWNFFQKFIACQFQIEFHHYNFESCLAKFNAH